MEVRRLHIGGKRSNPGWEVLNAVDGPGVDHLGNAKDLSRFEDDTFWELYASHVLEHFDYTNELGLVLGEWYRVLKPGGRIYISVPDLDVLARLILERDRLDINERFHVMRMMFGGQSDGYDYHKVGLNFEFLGHYLQAAGFTGIQKVDEFKIFNDTSSFKPYGTLISLNVLANKSDKNRNVQNP